MNHKHPNVAYKFDAFKESDNNGNVNHEAKSYKSFMMELCCCE
ncbi:hypothetical protein [Chondrinema litorale]|nr:hypothetical protein [Chondrinema litorale]UZR96853.1 hypothetical protein OQ292_24460 [Chondrinema litorale]